MRKFIVTFEMQNEYGEWFKDVLDNNGFGFTHYEAESVVHQIYETNLGIVRKVKVEQMKGDKK